MWRRTAENAVLFAYSKSAFTLTTTDCDSEILHSIMNTNKIHPNAESSSPIKVLIVDDDMRTRKGLRALLKTIHLTVADAACPRIELVGEAVNGLEALQMVETTNPEIVLMDVQMPEMDGIQATQKIKAKFPNVKIIILTVRSTSRAAALEAGADAFLIKGGATRELVDTIFSL
jgi:DNA-binding NarL/FixJ family response regulator